jgi:hypothetical protein
LNRRRYIFIEGAKEIEGEPKEIGTHMKAIAGRAKEFESQPPKEFENKSLSVNFSFS